MKGREDVVADCLSRNTMHIEVGEDVSAEASGEQGENEQRNQIVKSEDVIKGKRNQTILERRVECALGSQIRLYGPISIITITLGPSVTDEELKIYVNRILRRVKIYYLFSTSGELRERLVELYQTRQLNASVKLEVCLKKVETIERQEQQDKIIEGYHVGKATTG